MTDHFFPFEYGVSFCAICVDEYHDTTLSAGHVAKDVFEVGFRLMAVEEVDDFFLEELALEHVLD